MALDNVFVNYATGNDTTGTGVIGAPVKTMKKANSLVNPGGNVWLRGGTHVGGANNVWTDPATDALDTSGTVGNPTVWQNHEDETVVVQGDGNGINFPVVIIQNGSSYITFRASALGKFTIDGLTTSGDGFRPGVSSDHIILENMVIYRTRANGYQLGKSTDCQILNTTFEAIRQSSTPSGGHGIYCTENLLVDGSRFLNCEGYAIQIHLPSGSAFSGAIFRNNIIDHCGKLNNYSPGGGLDYAGTETTSNRTGAVTLWNQGSTNHLVYNNLIKNCATGIHIEDTSGHQLYFNTVYNSAINNFLAGSGASSLTVKNNVFLVSGQTNFSNTSSGSTDTNNTKIGTPSDMWVDPTVGYGNGDFRLLETSPLRGAGVAVGSVTVDWAGTTRLDPPDIGYLQFAEDNPDPPPGDTGLTITLGVMSWDADAPEVTKYRIYVETEAALDPPKRYFECPLTPALLDHDGTGTFNTIANCPIKLPAANVYFSVQPFIGEVAGTRSNEVEFDNS